MYSDYSDKIRNNYNNSNNSSRDQSPRSSSVSSRKSLKSGLSSLSLKRIVSRSGHSIQDSSPPTPTSSNASIKSQTSLIDQPIKHSETSNTILSNTDTLIGLGTEGNSTKPFDTNFDFSPLSHLNIKGDVPIDQSPLISSISSSSPKIPNNMASVNQNNSNPTPPKESPKEKGQSIINIILNGLFTVKNTILTVTTNSVNLTLDSIYKLSNSIAFSFNKVLTTFKENPLLTYDSVYISLSALIGTGAYYYHKNLLNSNLTCNQCINKNVPWEVIAGVSTFVGIFGIGNYLYLKKDSKARK